MNPVAVQVIPDEIAHRGRLDEITEIARGVQLAACDRDGVRIVLAVVVRVVVGAVAVPPAGQHVRLVRYVHRVRAVRQAGEQVRAVSGRRRRRHDVALVVQQHDGDAFKPSGLAALQRPVGVGVRPDRPADRVRHHWSVAEVLQQVGPVRKGRHQGQVVVVPVGIHGVVRARQGPAGHEVAGRNDHEVVQGRIQIGKVVSPVLVRRRRGQQRGARAVVQVHRHALAAFTYVERVVRIEVDENRVPDHPVLAVQAIGIGGGIAEVLVGHRRGRQVGHRTQTSRDDSVVVERLLQPVQHVGRVADPDQIVVRAGAVGHRQPGEQVPAVLVGHDRRNHRLARVPGPVAVAVLDQRHADARDSVLADSRLVRPVRVRFEPHRVADAAGRRRRRPVAEVRVDVHVAGSQHDGRCRPVVQGPIRVARLRIAGRRRHDHFINPGGQVVEQVVARGVRRRDPTRIRRVDVSVPVAVVPQRDGHVLQADFVRILDAVAVRVDPHPVADRAGIGPAVHVAAGRPVIAEVRGHVFLAGPQRHVGLAVGRRRSIVLVVRPVPQARGQRRCVHLDRVVPRREIVEQVPAVRAGHRRRNHRIRSPVAVGVAHQFDRHIGDPVLAGVLHAIRILVQPHPVADRAGQTDIAEVLQPVDLTDRQGDFGNAVKRGICIVCRAGIHGFRRRDAVLAGRQTAELVVSVHIRHGGQRQIVARRRQKAVQSAPNQFDRDPGDAVFADVLDAVPIVVVPDPVADRAQSLVVRIRPVPAGVARQAPPVQVRGVVDRTRLIARLGQNRVVGEHQHAAQRERRHVDADSRIAAAVAGGDDDIPSAGHRGRAGDCDRAGDQRDARIGQQVGDRDVIRRRGRRRIRDPHSIPHAAAVDRRGGLVDRQQRLDDLHVDRVLVRALAVVQHRHVPQPIGVGVVDHIPDQGDHLDHDLVQAVAEAVRQVRHRAEIEDHTIAPRVDRVEVAGDTRGPDRQRRDAQVRARRGPRRTVAADRDHRGTDHRQHAGQRVRQPDLRRAFRQRDHHPVRDRFADRHILDRGVQLPGSRSRKGRGRNRLVHAGRDRDELDAVAVQVIVRQDAGTVPLAVHVARRARRVGPRRVRRRPGARQTRIGHVDLVLDERVRRNGIDQRRRIADGYGAAGGNNSNTEVDGVADGVVRDARRRRDDDRGRRPEDQIQPSRQHVLHVDVVGRAVARVCEGDFVRGHVPRVVRRRRQGLGHIRDPRFHNRRRDDVRSRRLGNATDHIVQLELVVLRVVGRIRRERVVVLRVQDDDVELQHAVLGIGVVIVVDDGADVEGHVPSQHDRIAGIGSRQ